MIVLNNKKTEAINLRKKGYTFKEIIKEIKIAKSTLSNWISQEINKTEENKIKKITKKKGLIKLIKINKKRSLDIINKEKKIQEHYSQQIKKINSKALFWLGLGLYMAEGAKTGRWKPIFYNSDPSLNIIMMKYFIEICKAPKNRIHIQLVLHKGISENRAKNYWSKVLQIPKKMFYNASYVESKSSKGKRPKNILPYGTVQIAVGKKEVFNKIKGWTVGINNLFQ